MNLGVDFKDEEEVKEFLKNLHVEYQFGCHHEKNPETCHLLGDYYEGVVRDLTLAAKTYKDNCDSNKYGKSCSKFGAYTMFGKGTNTKPDHKAAYDYFEKSCKLDDPRGCFNQGFVLSTPDSHVYDPVKSVECFKKSCESKYAEACHFLSGIYIQGIPKKTRNAHSPHHSHPSSDEVEFIIPKDMKMAFMYSQKGCELGNMYACANLSQMYTRGDGVEKNVELGAEFKKLAIKMKSSWKDGVHMQEKIG